VFKKIGWIALLSFAFGFSANAGPFNWGAGKAACCRVKYEQCVLNYGVEGCTGVYEYCMLPSSGFCIID
jgi:hypothetical protein